MITIFFAIATSFYLFVSLTALLPKTLKQFQYLCLMLTILTCYILFSPMGQISIYIVLFCSLTLIVIFSKNKLANFVCALFGYLFAVVLNNLMLNLLPLLFHTELTKLSAIGELLFQTCFLFTLTIALLLFRHFFLPRLDFIFQKEYFSFLFCIIIEELLCIGVYTFTFIYGEKVGYPPEVIATNSFLFLLLFLFTIILLILVTLALHKVQETKLRMQQLEALESYTRDLEQLHKVMRTMNHDYKNLFSTACGFIDTGDLDGLKNFYMKSLNRISQDFDTSNKEISNLGNIHLPEIKGLLYSKSLRALALNLNLKIRIDYEIEAVSMDTTDLVRILRIYLDNAIEAAATTDSKTIFIYLSRNNKTTTWTIANSCPESNLPLSRINDFDFSTKGDGRGVGLFTVHELLKKYPKVLAGTQLLNQQFIQTLNNI